MADIKIHQSLITVPERSFTMHLSVEEVEKIASALASQDMQERKYDYLEYDYREVAAGKRPEPRPRDALLVKFEEALKTSPTETPDPIEVSVEIPAPPAQPPKRWTWFR